MGIFTKCVFFCGLLYMLTGCVSLKQVNSYATASYASIGKFDDIGYTFRQHDTDDSLFVFISNYHIAKDTEYAYPEAEKADSVTNLIYTAIKNYFDGLVKLSDPNLTNYNFGQLDTALTTGKFGKITINASETSAYAALASSIFSLTTDAHRSNLLKNYVTNAKQPLDVLLKAFIFILQRDLWPELRGRKDDIYNYYKTLGKIDPDDEKGLHLLLANKINSTYDKRDTSILILNKKLNSIYKFELQQAAAGYYSQIADLTIKQKQIEVYIKGLNEIQAGYQKLYDNIDKMSENTAKETISRSAGKIRGMIGAFNALKK